MIPSSQAHGSRVALGGQVRLQGCAQYVCVGKEDVTHDGPYVADLVLGCAV
jgi:hypothetical protein